MLGNPIGKDCYKIRIAISSKGKGKSGGARLITYVRIARSRVYLMDIYDKSEQANISDKELSLLINILTQEKFYYMKSLLLLTLVLNFAVGKPDQIFNTSLTITVRDELGNTVEGVSVKLFAREDDYIKEKNQILEGTTDAKGVVKFKKLSPESYFVLCRKGDKDNTGGGEKISQLTKGEFNKVTIVIQ